MKIRGKGKKERLCALGGPAQRALRAYLKQRRTISSDQSPKAAIFLNQLGGRLTARSFQRFFKLYLAQAGLPPEAQTGTVTADTVRARVISKARINELDNHFSRETQ